MHIGIDNLYKKSSHLYCIAAKKHLFYSVIDWLTDRQSKLWSSYATKNRPIQHAQWTMIYEILTIKLWLGISRKLTLSLTWK